jgi:Uri superfamily endonuclease
MLYSPAPGAVLPGRTGAIGRMVVRPGYYLYIGSARQANGIRQRVSHHFTPADELNLRWQIDDLRLLAPAMEIWFVTHRKDETYECQLSHRLSGKRW